MEERNLLVTGGTGFIGSALVDELTRLHNRVWVLSRFAEKHRPRSAVFYIHHLDELPQSEPMDAVINLAGEPLNRQRWNNHSKQRLLESRVITTTQLCNWMHKTNHPPEVLVSGSAIGWYGHQQQQQLHERSPAKDGFSHQLCQAWEHAAQAASSAGTRVCLLRIGMVLETDGGPLRQMLGLYRMGLGGRLGNGRQWWSWIHRQDLLNAILFLLDDLEITGPVNATAPYPVTQAKFAETLAATLHRPAKAHIPGWLLRLMLGEMADELLLNGQSVYPKKLLDAGFHFHYSHLEQALQQLLQTVRH